MIKGPIRHHALIPAKEKSSRCRNKNWREFCDGDCLVDFAIKGLPRGLFDKIIVSTDKRDYAFAGDVELHLRDRSLATIESSVIDLIKVILREYGIPDNDYVWLLNPTSPFRTKEDYRSIARLIRDILPPAVISATQVGPFLWEGRKALFSTKGKRQNTQNIKCDYTSENGLFYVFNAGHFRKDNSWYGKGVELYKQRSVWSSIDIDTEDDFEEARTISRYFALNHKG